MTKKQMERRAQKQYRKTLVKCKGLKKSDSLACRCFLLKICLYTGFYK